MGEDIATVLATLGLVFGGNPVSLNPSFSMVSQCSQILIYKFIVIDSESRVVFQAQQIRKIFLVTSEVFWENLVASLVPITFLKLMDQIPAATFTILLGTIMVSL